MKIDDLNKEQQKAVLKTEGPTLILAGAGSGKTRVLTTKIAYLIEEIGINPYNILAITFTNKAAKEMNDRLYHMIGDVSKKIQVSTFHSFGLKILRENCNELGYQSNFVIMDSEDTLSVIKKILKGLNLDPKQYNPSVIRNKISGCKNELMTPNDYEKYAISDFEEIVLKVYKKYEEMLFKNNAIDFDDLLILPIKLFKEKPSILQRYQERFQYILIDEYQDTNEAQYILTRMISSKYKNICCVGDNDQSIYSFRGANYRNILNFEKDYNDAEVIMLEQNYRSTSNILDAANNVIKNNRERKEKNLWSNKGEGDKISYFRAFNERDEALYVVREIKKLLNKGIEYKDVAVLYRTNAQSRNMEEELLKENLPYRVVGSFYFYSRKEIKDLIAYLRLIHNQNDNVSLLRVINTPKRGIGLKTIENLTNKADINGTSIFDSIESGKELEFKKLILDLKKISEELTLTELVDKILDVTGIKKDYEDEHTLEADVRIENLEEFKTITKTFEEREGVISLEDFLLEISLVSDVNEYKDDKNRISLMTVHSVKGLEFDYVFVIGLEEGIFPHINSLMDNAELEEERRLCYVAITRAKEKLHIVNARTRTIYGKESSNPPSRFIKEINDDLLIKEFKEDPENIQKMAKEEFFYKEDIDYKIGDFVYHEVFGHGKIVEVTNTLISIAFKHPHGIKKLMKNHKSIKKI
ncbi:MAG: UvrD-helicase domain-containing protein [Bacilli bacterium]|nr:UvrD-helicase domain-containing protein [Bacilli bacterium]